MCVMCLSTSFSYCVVFRLFGQNKLYFFLSNVSPCRSNSSSTASGPVNVGSAPVRPSSARKTPAQVKAEAAARRAKVIFVHYSINQKAFSSVNQIRNYTLPRYNIFSMGKINFNFNFEMGFNQSFSP